MDSYKIIVPIYTNPYYVSSYKIIVTIFIRTHLKRILKNAARIRQRFFLLIISPGRLGAYIYKKILSFLLKICEERIEL